MPLSLQKLAFGVRCISGRCAATWRVWNNGGSENDVYVACRALGGELKASLHQSGKWHISYSRKFHATGFQDIHRPSTRFPDTWHRPPAARSGFTVAHRIVVPWYAATSRARGELNEVFWVPPAAEGQAVEFTIIFTDKHAPAGEWPGSRSMKSGLVGSFPLPSGELVWVVWTVQPFALPQNLDTVPNYFKGKGRHSLIFGDLRAVAFAHHSDGSRVMYDFPVHRRRRGDA